MSFLIIKTSAIGDIIQSFPVIEYLREKFPGCVIDWVVERRYKDLLTSHPYVNQVFIIDSYRWRKEWYKLSAWKEILSFRHRLQTSTYEAVFDLQGNTKSALVTGWAKGRAKIGFGWSSVPEKPNLIVTTHRFNVLNSINIWERYLSLVQSYFQDKTAFIPQGVHLNLSQKEEEELANYALSSQAMNLILKTAVGLRPKDCALGPASTAVFRLMVAFGSKWDNKQLADGTLVSFLQKIDGAYQPYFFFVWGSERERETAEKLKALFPGRSCVVGKPGFALWQALMSRMDCVMAMDSAALHLCGTTKTPSFSVFGPSSASVYKPLGAQHSHVQGACPYHQHFVQRCPLLRTCSTGACMKNLEADELFQQFVKHVSSNK